ncbi:MAG TPA: RNA polymerase sigma factor [Clostridia bacterium]|nr:RNA polymerase sigma factor [Clostridia bacterium]
MEKPCKDLVKLAKQGDRQAFGELYSLYSTELYKYACYILGSSQLAQDAVQEAVCCAYAQISKLRNEDAFKSWLFKILSNTCKRIISTKKEYHLEDNEYICDFDRFDFEISIELAIAMEKLKPEERMVLILSSVYGYKSREISENLNCSASTVRSKLSRALKKLRYELE